MKNSNKLIQERRDQLLTLLKENGQLSVKDLSQQLDVSEITIRRDLMTLEKMGQIARSHGAASFIKETAIEDYNAEIEQIKQLIAQQAASFVNDGDTVFVNTGTTALAALAYLKNTRINVVTNNVKVADLDHNPNSTVILSGGEIRFPKEALVGDIAIESFSRMRSDVSIIGCSGLTAETGITTSVLHESKINSVILQNSPGLTIVVADYRKIGHSSNFTSGQLSDVDILITDTFANAEVLREIEKHEVQIIQIPV